MKFFISLLLLLLFFAIALFIGFVAGVISVTAVKKNSESDLCPHGENWDNCPDCRH